MLDDSDSIFDLSQELTNFNDEPDHILDFIESWSLITMIISVLTLILLLSMCVTLKTTIFF